MTATPFRCLYAVREKYPTFRVDLTELISSGLARKGHMVDWHMQSDTAGATRWVRTAESERVYVGRAWGGRKVLTQVLNLLAGLLHDLRLYRMAFAHEYDFIQVRDKVFAGLVGLCAAKTRGIPFFYWMSFPYPEADFYRAGNSELRRISLPLRCFYRLRGAITAVLLYKILLPRAAHVFVQSDRMKENVAANGIAPERMTAVPMGINLDHVAERATGTAAPSAKPMLVYVGAMMRLRRMEFLLEMMARVRQQMPDVELLMIGDGLAADMAFLRSETERLELTNHVRFTGALPMEQAWDWIQKADVCLSPIAPNPIFDMGTPTKIIEYMAFNKVVVANHHPDQDKLLKESGAGFAVAFEPQAFADAVLALLRDPGMARAMADKGFDYVRSQRSYAVLSAALEARYLELLGRPSAVRLAGATPV